MATNLTPDLMTQLNGMGKTTTLNGRVYGSVGVGGTDEGGSWFNQNGYASYDPAHMKPGDYYDLYGTDGSYAGQKQIMDGGALDPKMLALAGLMVGGSMFLPGISGAGATVGAGGLDGLTASMGAGGAGAGTAATTAGTDIFGGNGMATGFTDTGTAGGAAAGGDAYAGSGAVTGATGTAAPVLTNGTSAIPTGSSTGIPPTTNPTTGIPKIPTIPGTGGGSGGGSAGTGGINLNTLLGLLSGGYGMQQQTQASNDMLNYLKQRQQMNDNMYAPGSPEATRLWDEMSRKDAAAGRNSQYGPRSVDLAARIAQLKMDANTRMTTGIGNFMANALNQRANAAGQLTSMLPLLTGGNGSGGLSLNDIINWVNGGSQWSDNPTPSDDGHQPGDGVGPIPSGNPTTTGGYGGAGQFNDNNNPNNVGPMSPQTASAGPGPTLAQTAGSPQSASISGAPNDVGVQNLTNYLQANATGPSGSVQNYTTPQGVNVQDASGYTPATSGWDDKATSMWLNTPQYAGINGLDKLNGAYMQQNGKVMDANMQDQIERQIESGANPNDLAKTLGLTNYTGQDPVDIAKQTIAADPTKYAAAQQTFYKSMGWTLDAFGHLRDQYGNDLGKA